MVLFGFPLYYCQQVDVTAALHDILTELGSVDAAPVVMAKKLSLAAYPNPFNPATTICYSLPASGEVSVEIYNVKGRKVRTLVSGYRDAGSYSVVWNGEDDGEKPVASGLYLYRIQSGKNARSEKCLLLK